MRILRSVISLICVVLCLGSVFVNVSADSYTPQPYIVRLYAGDPKIGVATDSFSLKKGDDKDLYSYGESASFFVSESSNLQMVDKKYYPKGIHEAGIDYMNYGHDSSKPYSYIAFSGGYATVQSVKRDQDYVVVYGIRGTQVQYTLVCYEGNTDNVLRVEYYYGDAGDKGVVVTLPYIEGWVPPSEQAIIPEVQEGIVYSARYTRYVTTTTVIEGGGGGGGGNPNPNPDTTPTQPEVVAPAPPIPPIENIPEVIYINENNTPLAEFEDVEGPGGGLALPEVTPSPSPTSIITIDGNGKISLPPWAIYSTIGLLAVMIGLLYWYLLFYRKKKKYASMNEEDYDFSDLDLDEFDDFSK